MNIILKADDLAGYPGKDKTVPKRWQKFVDIIEKHNIKANIGVIGNSLIFEDKKYFKWIKKYNKSGLIEFWNHGFLHRQFKFDNQSYREFRGTNKKYQFRSITYSNKLAKKRLGFKFKTFGAPYNAIDENTSKALNKTDIKYYFFGLKSFKGINITNRINIEYPTHIVNLDYFNKNFKKLDYIVIQVHPNSWDINAFKEFENMILFLLEKRCEFILAKELKI
ncbi:MAG: DUF2334 domain-containing protein [Campylobacterota bacterium]|nr:DUF2334 domain-containing protein [Campylobacterota bacterium]